MKIAKFHTWIDHSLTLRPPDSPKINKNASNSTFLGTSCRQYTCQQNAKLPQNHNFPYVKNPFPSASIAPKRNFWRSLLPNMQKAQIKWTYSEKVKREAFTGLTAFSAHSEVLVTINFCNGTHEISISITALKETDE